jgi:hypothetical protein
MLLVNMEISSDDITVTFVMLARCEPPEPTENRTRLIHLCCTAARFCSARRTDEHEAGLIRRCGWLERLVTGQSTVGPWGRDASPWRRIDV